ncbi:UNVERIFIED_CONTAM: hypothetical protein Slati_2996200 [Sesamum latifolium]|uniref:CCHC-type domain-containing protein n=1 Tax=Sesamum latifolium TaxID=2727402 RepID=A0AAW2VEN9_9LAMI
MALYAQAQAQAQFFAQAHAPIPAPTPAVATIDRNYERIRKIGATEFEGGGNFSRGGPTFRGNSGPRFSGPVGFNGGSIEGSSFTMPSIGSGRGAGQSYNRGPAFIPSCSTCGRRHLGQCGGPDATPRICYNCGGRGYISRDCPGQTPTLGGSAFRGTQSQSSIGSSGRGTERGRSRGRVEALVIEMVTTLLVGYEGVWSTSHSRTDPSKDI